MDENNFEFLILIFFDADFTIFVPLVENIFLTKNEH